MFKYIKSLGIICLSIYSFASGPNQAVRYFDNSKGLLDHTNPIITPDQYCQGIQNVSLYVKGQLSKRNGNTQLNTTSALGTSAVTGGRYHNAASGSNFFGIVIGTDVYRTGNTFNGTYTKVTSTVTLTSGASNLAQATSLNDTEIFCNESDKPFKLGSTGNAVHLTETVFTGGKTCSTYGNYLIVGNTTESGTAYPSRIRWSDINNPDSFPTLNYIDVEPNDGDRIVAVTAFEDSVYIFKKRSIFRMLITGLDGPDAFIIRPVSRNIGAWAKNSVKAIPNVGVAFLAQNTMYVLSDNGLEPIGDPIQNTFNSVTRSMWGNAVAEVYPKTYQYWIAVSTTADNQNHLVLVYDYVQKAWAYYTGQDVNMIAQAEDSTGQNIILTGDYAGNHYKQDTTATADTVAGVSKNISFSYTTPDYSIAQPEYTKGFKYLYIFFNVVSSSVTVETAYDYSTTYESSQAIGLGSIGAIYDTSIYDVGSYPESGQNVTRVELNRSAKAVRLRFTENSANAFSIYGWTIVYSMEDWKE